MKHMAISTEVYYHELLDTYRALCAKPCSPEVLAAKELVANRLKACGWLRRACIDLGFIAAN